MLNRVVKSFTIFLISLFISSCFQIEEYKDDFFTDDADISTREDSFSYLSRNMVNNGNSLEYSFTNLTGTETIIEVLLDTPSNLDISYLLEMDKGEIKCVLISPDKTNTTLYPGINSLSNLAPGSYLIRLISYNSTGRVALRYTK